MFDDFKELLSIFNAHRVKYLIVGGYAVSFHAQPRVTKDIDLLIEPDAENAFNLKNVDVVWRDMAPNGTDHTRVRQ